MSDHTLSVPTGGQPSTVRRVPALFLQLAILGAVIGLVLPDSALATFPGLNGKLVFHSNRRGPEDVFVKAPRRDAADVNRSDNPARDIAPHWSADGTRIAFASDRDGDYEIFTMKADGTDQTQLTFNIGVDDRNPTWSRDGSRLAFERRITSDAPSEIYIVPAGGGNPQNCTNNGADDHNASWSPIEDKLAFSSNRSAVSEDIWVTTVAGTGCASPSNLTDHPYSAFNRGPNWSPDGQRIAFYSDRNPNPDVPGDRNEDVWVMRADGTGLTNLTRASHYPSGLPAADRNPAWSPDGTMIAFDTDRGQPGRPPPDTLPITEIWLIKVDGSNPTQLSEAGDVGPDWQPTFAPQAVFDVPTGPVLTGQPVTFQSASTDRFGTITRHQWDLDGDGDFELDTGTRRTAVGAYAAAGPVTPHLMVTNSDGNTDVTSRSLTIATRRPSAFLFVDPNQAFAGQLVTFDGSASSDPDGSIVNYSWDLDGDGRFERNTGSTPTTARAYTSPSTLTVRLRVTDNDGAASDSEVSAFSARKLTVLPRLILSQATLRAASTKNGVIVRLLRLSDVPDAARVELTCKRGKRRACRRQVQTTANVSFGRLRGQRLRNGTTIEIRITKRDHVGKYIRYTIRRGSFRRIERCIRPGERRPETRCV